MTKLIRLVPEGSKGLEPCAVVPAEALLPGSAQPVERGAIELSDGETTGGIWEATPYAESFDNYPFHEMAHVISGRVVITPAGGEAQSFGPGDTYLMEKGFTGTFEVTETLRKFYFVAA
ncbi:cupin domain-containing protein [Alloyangia pacifica]|uniref:(S)-ureidoglycine aminohydrolase cupin domain-containing protein n=1 Tax=Alloyangia pacifica TaxID=311180 RepID=A0A1I6VNK0_9RHOB|nr:cupin domain-containing protein [Alloyangia pacifica]SDI07292.1 hypothetical protein SAMN04488245_11258 [Alloyangia pacifica]SFT15302.1 hypothetical protein SAMN04488050_11258 [Alloyangia pacifica]